MQKAITPHESPVARKLWYDHPKGRTQLTQDDILDFSGPLIILGEAGMGKSHLLEWLASFSGYVYCTARKLINCYDPRTLLTDGQTLVIDALDEVSAQRDGDAAGLVLRQLGALGFPRFILSCRVADWRSATGREAIREQYAEEPLELHIEPFDDDDAVQFLSARLGIDRAQTVITHFNDRGLDGLLGNPQTLDLISRIAVTGDLPESQGELFRRATDVLWVEHQETKAYNQLASTVALGAAGAAFASLILTGSEAIVRKASAHIADGELQLIEVAQLPHGAAVQSVLGTRLFRAKGADRFSYWHRRIGEYLGARWLANLADTQRKRRRLLSLFHCHSLVPASLRGMHAWLAQDPLLAPAVISADPIGFIEYGDADNLTTEHARVLLNALEATATENPSIRSWGSYSLRGIAQPALIDELKRLITAPDTPFGLQHLLLRAIRNSAIASNLTNELRAIVIDAHAIYACRSVAGKSLKGLTVQADWLPIFRKLHQLGDEYSVRLAIELYKNLDYEPFDDKLICDLVFTYAKVNKNTVGVLTGLAEQLCESKIELTLDELAAQGREDQNLTRYSEIIEVVFQLVVRRLMAGNVNAEQLWSWLEPFDASSDRHHQSCRKFSELICQNAELRQPLQRFVLLELESERTIYHRYVLLSWRSAGFSVTEHDALKLLEALDPKDLHDERWREVVQLISHDGKAGEQVRAAAKIFAQYRSETSQWIDELATPKASQWEIEQAENARRKREELAAEHAEHRNKFSAELPLIRTGESDSIFTLAKAYLGLFHDIGEEFPAHERISQWLGQELSSAAHLGFEAFLMLDPPNPTATQIAQSHAQGNMWHASQVIVAALAERTRMQIGFDDLSDERLMAGLFELRRSGIDVHAGISRLTETIEEAIQTRGVWPEAMRKYHEPQLQLCCENVDGLHSLVKDQVHTELAASLSIEWLERFSNIPARPEAQLIDCALRSRRYEDLCRILARNTKLTDDERRRNWDAVGLIVDFEETRNRLESAPIERDLLLNLKHRLLERQPSGTMIPLDPIQLEWIIGKFRLLWPSVKRPYHALEDENPFDACSFLIHLAQALGNDASELATNALRRLRNAPVDGYTDAILTVAAEQARMRVEAAYSSPTLTMVAAVSCDEAPISTADLQAIMIEELEIVQAKINSDDIDSWRGFYDDTGAPHEEERCRDCLVGLLRQSANGITLDLETHVAADKAVDITCSSGMLRLPIEIKGQWHSELWRGADAQLDRLYTKDWRAGGRGIYLVLWFGDQPKKRLKNPSRGMMKPGTSAELREMITTNSSAAREGRITVFVLDLERAGAHRREQGSVSA